MKKFLSATVWLNRAFHMAILATLFVVLSTSIAAAQDSTDPQNQNSEVTAEELMAEGATAIDNYLLKQSITVEPDSVEYQEFLYQVLKDLHPGLHTDEHAAAVTYYAITQLGLQPDTETQDAIIPTHFVYMPLIQAKDANVYSDEQIVEAAATNAYNRSVAVSYANNWVSTNGGKKRNTALYPDFVENDCTNFTSQVAFAGGIPRSGDGTCRNEATTTEWYVKKLPALCGWPWQSYRDWAWSTSWSTVGDFRIYMRDRANAYVEAYGANDNAVSLLISRVQPGDFVQFDVNSCGISGCSWVPTHAVAVVEKRPNSGYSTADALYNDHSGNVNGNDTFKRGLRSKLQQWVGERVTNSRRMVWIQMR